MDWLFEVFAVVWIAFSLPASVGGVRARRGGPVPVRGGLR